MSAWIHSLFIVQSLNLACAHDKGTAELPKSSEDFFASFTCNSVHDSDSNLNEEGDPFFRWVLPARHTTWHPGWEVAPRPTGNVTGKGELHYARVFDLLNWSRKHNLLPVPVDISSICHKGMEAQFVNGIGSWTDENSVPPTPNEFISNEIWSTLWNTCHKQLLSTTRISSSCIDVPGLLVRNPSPPWNVNNPCHLEYRMVDGAHRICLRKYLSTLLSGELAELEELAKRENREAFANSVMAQIRHKQRLVNQTTRGPFLVMNQTAFLSMLMTSDPYTSWAKDKENLMKDATGELLLEWKKWMLRVMDRVGVIKNEHCESECSDY
mmetsp:Transcript_15298/g.33366  ORF Transcript_15298/g.33366 Transcript_15298/m.33366 type:complete len:325 (-) Transcript_15298:597-1571(-)